MVRSHSGPSSAHIKRLLSTACDLIRESVATEWWGGSSSPSEA